MRIIKAGCGANADRLKPELRTKGNEMDGVLMRLGEVMEVTGLGKRTVLRLADAGRFAVVRPAGGQRMYLRKSVMAWVAEIGNSE